MRIIQKIRREILVALSKIGLRKATVYRAGNAFRIPLIHGMGRYLFVTREPWRRKILRAIGQMNPDTLLDVGVNVGQTLLDMKEIMPTVRYIGFEPNPSCVSYVNELIKLQNFQQTSVMPFGLGSASSMRQLFSSCQDDPSGSLSDREGVTTQPTSVYIKKGDEFFAREEVQEISFIKIDAEGHELHVLKGLRNSIEKHRPIIFCEVFSGNQSNSKGLYDFLQAADYQLFQQGNSLSLETMSSENLFNNPASRHDYIFAPRNKTELFKRYFNND